jgi:hypothetical protein
MGSSLGHVKPKTIKLVFFASPLNTEHYAVKAKTGNSWGQQIFTWLTEEVFIIFELLET